MKIMKYTLSLVLSLFLFLSCNSQSGEGKQAGAANQAQSDEPEGVVPIEDIDGKYEEQGLAEATFAGGCFWCTEAVFERVKGVEAVYSGYAGGSLKNPSYQQVASGATDHAEAIRIYYHPEVVDYRTLLEVFFLGAHDPTQLNRQGPDIGAQYRSAIFFHDKEQKQIAEAYMKELRKSGKFDKPIVTELSRLNTFYKAEAYHQDYYELDNPPNAGYIRNVTRPKVEKFMKEFKHLLKDEYKA